MTEIEPPVIRHIEALTELVPPAGLRVVDVGCGDGAMVRALTRLNAEVTGIEIDAQQLAPALAAVPAAGSAISKAVARRYRSPMPPSISCSISTACTMCPQRSMPLRSRKRRACWSVAARH
ncbi:MAG: methyltransferase domain-containing protein [Aliidongia sp.]